MDLKVIYKENKPYKVRTSTAKGDVEQTLIQFKQQMFEHSKSLVKDLLEYNVIREQEQYDLEERVSQGSKVSKGDNNKSWTIIEDDSGNTSVVILHKGKAVLRVPMDGKTLETFIKACS